MKLTFTKMQGCGNDYIYFNCFEQEIQNPGALSVKFADRHFGIGGDGIILICPSETADAKMIMYNNDGSEGMMCGNAIRCVGKYLYDNGIVKKQQLNIETASGIKTLILYVKDDKVTDVSVNMGRAILEAEKVPVDLPVSPVINYPFTVDGQEYKITCVSMGNPHCVIFGGDPYEIPIEKMGPKFEKHRIFPDKANVEFIQFIDSHTLKMRVWERGSGETWACGTGACAAAVAGVLNGLCPYDEDITVHLRGGDLIIRYAKEGLVTMTGEAVTVFEGTVEVADL